MDVARIVWIALSRITKALAGRASQQNINSAASFRFQFAWGNSNEASPPIRSAGKIVRVVIYGELVDISE
jgi:hypothetical protein